MAKAPLSDEARKLLAQPNPAVIATLRADGQPVTVGTWYDVDPDGRVLVNMDEERRRIAYMRNDGRVSLTALEDGNWSTHVSVQGRVDEWRDDPDLTDIDRLAQRYVGRPYSDRTRRRVSALIEVETWSIWH
ncbi:MAG: TIGR03618 family F420-dependent PPOX class oxidoreductase [Nocardioidaceae bacterium]